MGADLVIRPEAAADHAAIDHVVRSAFSRHPDEVALLVEGIPAYYPRFGFERASPLGFVAPSASIPDAAFMVKRLPGYDAGLAGRIVYAAAFDHLTH